MSFVPWLLLAASLVANAFLTHRLRGKPASDPAPDARLILSDLLRGQALVRIVRVAPEEVFLRSPRDSR